MWSNDEIDRVCELAKSQLGKPYAIGGWEGQGKDKIYVVRGKPGINNPNPRDFDCSGFSRWIIAQGLDENKRCIVLPHGCVEQIKFCRPLAHQAPRRLDLGFASLHSSDGSPDHVIVRYDDYDVIEARGEPRNMVIMRPIKVWENQKGFLGWWEVPGVYHK